MSPLNCVSYVLTCQCACVLTCSCSNLSWVLACSRANVSTVIKCSCANVPCMLTCSHVNVPCVLLYSLANVPGVLTCSRANVPCVRGDVPCVLTYKRYLQFFFQVKLFFRPIFYWDEKSLWNKVEARRVTTNALYSDLSRAFTHKGSSKMTKKSSRFPYQFK